MTSTQKYFNANTSLVRPWISAEEFAVFSCLVPTYINDTDYGQHKDGRSRLYILYLKLKQLEKKFHGTANQKSY